MRVHKIKIKEMYAERKFNGQKKFEVRLNDRDYQVGDIIKYEIVEREYADVLDKYEKLADEKIIYIHSGYGLADGFVILGVEPITRQSIMAMSINEAEEELIRIVKDNAELLR
jgi:hypothetical protein